MKNRVFKIAGFATILLLVTGILSSVNAQAGQGQFRAAGRPNQEKILEKVKLTDDQQKQMSDLRMQFRQESIRINDLIKERRAHLKTLIDTDNRDMKDLDKTIAELTTLKADLIKKAIVHRDAVKKILSPEQMIIWERRVKQHMGKGMQGLRTRGMSEGSMRMRNR